MTESTPRQKILWIIGTIVVLFYALIPVLWIISLSLKDPTTIGDQKFFPTKWTLRQLQRRLQRRAWASTHALINSIGIAHDHDADRARLRVDGGLRDHPPGVPGQDR